MQPQSVAGRRIRFALMPISWIVAFAFLYFLMTALARIAGTSVRELFQTDSLWLLAVLIPGFLSGKMLGLITINVLAFFTPPLRRLFEEEVNETGRHSFSVAMEFLGKALAVLALITLAGACLFLKFR